MAIGKKNSGKFQQDAVVSCSIKYSESEEMIQIINQDGKVVFGGNYWDFDSSPEGFKRLFESLGLKVSMDDTYRYE